MGEKEAAMGRVLNVIDFNSMKEGGRQEEKDVLILATHGFLLR